jgi:hypothetical protein
MMRIMGGLLMHMSWEHVEKRVIKRLSMQVTPTICYANTSSGVSVLPVPAHFTHVLSFPAEH